ncbi:MAG TPA: extracellular solute-binding protein [Spirochaetia bacterium]|nr:extracellular solute-binding protein [Spirochaetia bacterium]
MRGAVAAVSVLLCVALAACAPPRRPAVPAHRVRLSVLAGQSTTDPGIEVMIDDLLKSKAPGVELEWERMDWGEKFQSAMQAKFAAGEVPDIMIGKAQDVATYAPTGNLAAISADLLRYVRDSAVAGVSVSGRAYGIPYNAFYQGVFYNKDIFATHDLHPPTSRAGLLRIVHELQAAGITPFASHFTESWYLGNIVMQFALGDVFSRTPAWGTEFRAGRVSFQGSADFRQCFLDVRQVLQWSWKDALNIDFTESDQRFASGKAAMYVTGSWSLQAIDGQKPHINVGVFPWPNRNGTAKLIFEPNMTFMESSRSSRPDAVQRVLTAIFESNDLASEILDFTKTSSMLRNFTQDAPLLIQTDIDRAQKTGMVADATVGNTQLIWSFQDRVARELGQWLQGKIDLEEVVRDADANRSLSGP